MDITLLQFVLCHGRKIEDYINHSNRTENILGKQDLEVLTYPKIL